MTPIYLEVCRGRQEGAVGSGSVLFLVSSLLAQCVCIEATRDIFRQMDCIIDVVLSVPRVTI